MKSYTRNYGASHDVFKLSSKRVEKSPFIQFYPKKETVFGIYANRFYPLSMGDDPNKKYWKLRKDVMLYEVPEKPIEIRGKDSITLIEKVFTRKASDLKNWRARYMIACNHEGGIVMDGVLIRLGKHKFWYIHADGDFQSWLVAHSSGLDVCIEDLKSWALQIQGPKSLEVLKKLTKSSEIESFRYFHARKFNFEGQNLLVSRTGWTGELGFEIYTMGSKKDQMSVWKYILAKGKQFGIEFSGLDSMGIRRIEAGILDYGTDMSTANTPFEVGLGKYVDFTCENFIGREKLLTSNKNCLLFGIRSKEAIPFQDCEVFHHNRKVGKTTTGAFSPFLKEGIGYVLFEKQSDWDGRFLSFLGKNGKSYGCSISKLPFFDTEKKIPRGLI